MIGTLCILLSIVTALYLWALRKQGETVKFYHKMFKEQEKAIKQLTTILDGRNETIEKLKTQVDFNQGRIDRLWFKLQNKKEEKAND